MSQQRYRKAVCVLASLTMTWPAYGATQSDPVPKIVGCHGDVSKVLAEIAPKTSGPLRLHTFYCTGTPEPGLSQQWVSPGGDVKFVLESREQLAFKDAKHGRTLQSVALSSFTKAKSPGIFHASTRVDPRGRVRAVFSLYSFGRGESYEWTQGQLPKRLPYLLGHWTWFALTPDSKYLLVQHNLSASGAICEGDDPCPRKSRHGTIADLREVDTGRILWELNGTAADIALGYKPAVSLDGRYAVITIPSTDERMMNSRGSLALIAMNDGHVVQVLNGCPCSLTIDFTSDGRSLRISRPSSVATYQFGN